jgi:AAA15 family ATPase/GTPase
MLDSLHIKNYRLFKDFKINSLKRVNLIMGKNNVGKTSLLEAIWLYIHQANPSAFELILRQRGENIRNFRNENRPEEIDKIQAMFKSLFYKRILADKYENRASTSPVNNSDNEISLYRYLQLHIALIQSVP